MAVKQPGGPTGPAKHGVLRDLNRALVLRLLREDGAQSRADLVEHSGLAKPTVAAVVTDLLRLDLIEEIGARAAGPSGGRPAVLLRYNSRHRIVVGVDIGSRTMMAIAADAEGVELARAVTSTPRRSATRALEAAIALVRRVLDDAGATTCDAVGVALPGLVDPDKGVCLSAASLRWRDVPVTDTIANVLETPVTAINAAQAALLAEVDEGVASNASDAVLVLEDEGIGGAALSGGQIVRGSRGVAGEIGHCAVPGARGRCNCGKAGCLETVAGAPALAQQVLELSPAALARTRAQHASLAELAQIVNPDVQQLLHEAGTQLGSAISWLVNLFNPSLVVLAGGLPQAGPAYLRGLETAALAAAMPQAKDCVSIVTSDLPHSPARGAVLAALSTLAPVLDDESVARVR